jgi:hypothetical protein
VCRNHERFGQPTGGEGFEIQVVVVGVLLFGANGTKAFSIHLDSIFFFDKLKEKGLKGGSPKG